MLDGYKYCKQRSKIEGSSALKLKTKAVHVPQSMAISGNCFLSCPFACPSGDAAEAGRRELTERKPSPEAQAAALASHVAGSATGSAGPPCVARLSSQSFPEEEGSVRDLVIKAAPLARHLGSSLRCPCSRGSSPFLGLLQLPSVLPPGRWRVLRRLRVGGTGLCGLLQSG